jgi:hypothetical protein
MMREVLRIGGLVGILACGGGGDDPRGALGGSASDAGDDAETGACVFNGRAYRDQENMPPNDCNACVCSRGRRTCNIVGCPIQCRVDTGFGEATYFPGQPTPSTNACESCVCGGRGPSDVICTPIHGCMLDAGAD